eukprot:3300434-Pleurochrysis_carterae.AAC.1
MPPTGRMGARASAASRSPFTAWPRLGDAGSAHSFRGCASGGGSRSAIQTRVFSPPNRRLQASLS